LCASEKKQSEILLNANICHKDWKGRYLPWLLGRKLIKASADPEAQITIYKTTTRGEKWLTDYAEYKKKIGRRIRS